MQACRVSLTPPLHDVVDAVVSISGASGDMMSPCMHPEYHGVLKGIRCMQCMLYCPLSILHGNAIHFLCALLLLMLQMVCTCYHVLSVLLTSLATYLVLGLELTLHLMVGGVSANASMQSILDTSTP